MNLSEFRSLRWIDYFLYALTDPRALYRMIQKNVPASFGLSFSVPVMLVVIEIITITVCNSVVGVFAVKISYGWLLGSIILILSIVINASLMDLLSQLLGFKGNIKEKITLLNFAFFPRFFILPFMYIFYVFNFAMPFFYLVFSITFSIWGVAVVVQGISEMHAADLGKAILIVFFPVILMAISFILIITLFSFLFVGLLA